MRNVSDFLDLPPISLQAPVTLGEALRGVGAQQGALVWSGSARPPMGVWSPLELEVADLHRLDSPLQVRLRESQTLSGKDCCLKAMEVMVREELHHLAVLGESQDWTVLGFQDLLRAIHSNSQQGARGFDILGPELGERLRVVLQQRVDRWMHGPVLRLSPEDSLFDFFEICQTHQLSSVPVSGPCGLEGLLSLDSVGRALVRGGTREDRVRAWIQRDCCSVTWDETLEVVVEVLLARGESRVLVVDDVDHPVGVFTALDLFATVLRECSRRQAA